MPRAAASLFTGDGASARPRPAARSGRVITPVTRWRDSSSPSRQRAANSGVPAKRTFTEAARAQGLRERQRSDRLSNAASGGFAELFLKLGLDALLLEARQIVDEDFALEVIHLVLDANREELVCDEGERLAVQIERAHGDALGALDRLVDSGDRQAAFLAGLRAFPADDFRVDQKHELVPALGGIDDDHPPVHLQPPC